MNMALGGYKRGYPGHLNKPNERAIMDSDDDDMYPPRRGPNGFMNVPEGRNEKLTEDVNMTEVDRVVHAFVGGLRSLWSREWGSYEWLELKDEVRMRYYFRTRYRVNNFLAEFYFAMKAAGYEVDIPYDLHRDHDRDWVQVVDYYYVPGKKRVQVALTFFKNDCELHMRARILASETQISMRNEQPEGMPHHHRSRESTPVVGLEPDELCLVCSLPVSRPASAHKRKGSSSGRSGARLTRLTTKK
jgi:hypothetical protein